LLQNNARSACRFNLQTSAIETRQSTCFLKGTSISTLGKQPGLDHLGIQVESQDELQEVYGRLRKAGGSIIEQGQTSCCYAKSEKSWTDA